MIPRNMEAYLKEHLPKTAIENRIERVNGKRFLEFGYTDELLLSRMGINCDKLGPRLVACMWDEASSLEIGPDVGTNDADMKTIAVENGIDSAVSKPADMGGNRIDELGAAAGGLVIALERLLEIMPRLTVLS